MMLFNEIFSTYYNVVSEIISCAIQVKLDEKKITEIVTKKAFGESVLTIPTSLKTEKWQLITKDFKTPIQIEPKLPLTTLEKRWLKSISMDNRIKLFDVDFSGLEDVEPLFTPEMIKYYDRYEDGDDYEDNGYIERFRLIVKSLKAKTPLKIEIATKSGNITTVKVIPKHLEYSEKDDKFRIIVKGDNTRKTINLSSIVSCKPYLGESFNDLQEKEIKQTKITFTLIDERNTMERVMLHFAHLEKQVQKISDNSYIVNLVFDAEDESEMLIRILSFGPFIKVIEPESFVNMIKERLSNQKKYQM